MDSVPLKIHSVLSTTLPEREKEEFRKTGIEMNLIQSEIFYSFLTGPAKS